MVCILNKQTKQNIDIPSIYNVIKNELDIKLGYMNRNIFIRTFHSIYKRLKHKSLKHISNIDDKYLSLLNHCSKDIVINILIYLAGDLIPDFTLHLDQIFDIKLVDSTLFTTRECYCMILINGIELIPTSSNVVLYKEMIKGFKYIEYYDRIIVDQKGNRKIIIFRFATKSTIIQYSILTESSKSCVSVISIDTIISQ